MTENLKIVSIIPYQVLPARLGGEKGIAVFNEYLAKRVQFTGISTKNNDPSLARGYTLLNVLSNSRLRYINVFLYFTVRAILRRHGASHLLIEHPYYGWLAWLLKVTMKIRVVVHSHNIEFMRSRSIGRKWWKLLKWYEGWVYRFADNVFFISEDDRKFAIDHLGVEHAKSMAVTYGIEEAAIPNDRDACRQQIKKIHGISDDEKIFLFNGALYHSTNYEALQVILEHINPFLLASDLRYRIIICGKGLPHFFNELSDYRSKNIVYAGFVDDIAMYFKSADVFLNPILSGGGIKTKAVEALAMNCTVVSTALGALGIRREVCGQKLFVVNAGKWQEFSESVITAANDTHNTPTAFFDYYYWGNIIDRVVAWLQTFR